MYNFKLVEYANGSAQIRMYSECMGATKEFQGLEEWEQEIEPFTGKVVKVVKDFSSYVDKEESRRVSLARTKRMVSDYARSAVWKWFVTLTFAPNCVDRTDFKECMAKVRNWLNNARKRSAPDLKYLVVPELHSDLVSWHLHMLLADIGEIKLVDSGHRRTGQIVYNLPGWRFGFSDVTEVQDVFRVQKYVLKYITKESHVIGRGAHRYYASHNLPKPKSSLWLLNPAEQEEMVQILADSLGKTVVYRYEMCGTYSDVTYIELQGT